jgi:hypothetical protein
MPEDGMCTWLRLFPWLTITGRCWAEVLKLHLKEVSGIRGAGMPNFLRESLCPDGRLTNSWKFMLLSLLPENSATREDFSGLNSVRKAPKTVF